MTTHPNDPHHGDHDAEKLPVTEQLQATGVPVDEPDAVVESVTEDVAEVVSQEADSVVDDNSFTHSASSEPEVVRITLQPHPNTQVDRPCVEPLTEKHQRKFNPSEKLQLVTVTVDEINHMFENFPNTNVDDDPAAMRWSQVIDTGLGYLPRGNALHAAINRETSAWRQSVQFGSEKMMAGRPRQGDSAEGTELLTGERAALKMSAILGLGQIIQIPLWHTGIWLSLKTPSEAELLELDRMVSREKILLGRVTNGLTYSNVGVYTNAYLFNFVLSKVYDATVKDISQDALKKLILVNDIPLLIWGLACAIWPNGYPYEKACTAGPAECMHVVKELLDIHRLCFTNDRAFSESQRRHMANRNAKKSIEEVKRYQEEHQFNDGRIFDLRENAVSIELKVPSLSEYEESGYDWIDAIIRNTDRAFGTTMTEQERDDYISAQGKVTAMRQYAHWVSRLVIHDHDKQSIVEDRRAVESSIELLSSEDELQDSFFEHVGKYIDKTTVSMIAIPRYECPRCGLPMTDEAKLHPHLIPLDIARLFFTLLGQRVTKATSRLLI